MPNNNEEEKPQSPAPPPHNILPILDFFLRKCCELQNLNGDNACAILPAYAEQIKHLLDPSEVKYHVEYNESSEQYWLYPVRFWRATELRRQQLKAQSEKWRQEDEENRQAKAEAYKNVYIKCRTKHMTDDEIQKLLTRCELGEDPAMASIFKITKWCKQPKRTKIDSLRDSFFGED